MQIATIVYTQNDPLAVMIGAEGQMLEQCVLYGRILLLALPFFMLQFEFESFFVAAEKPQLGLAGKLYHHIYLLNRKIQFSDCIDNIYFSDIFFSNNLKQ